VLDNILKFPSDVAPSINLNVNQIENLEQFRTADGLVSDVDKNKVCNSEEYVPPMNTFKITETENQNQINLDIVKDNIDTCSNSSANTNDLKIMVELTKENMKNNIS
jgi:hypothetical protein